MLFGTPATFTSAYTLEGRIYIYISLCVGHIPICGQISFSVSPIAPPLYSWFGSYITSFKLNAKSFGESINKDSNSRGMGSRKMC